MFILYSSGSFLLFTHVFWKIQFQILQELCHYNGRSQAGTYRTLEFGNERLLKLKWKRHLEMYGNNDIENKENKKL